MGFITSATFGNTVPSISTFLINCFYQFLMRAVTIIFTLILAISRILQVSKMHFFPNDLSFSLLFKDVFIRHLEIYQTVVFFFKGRVTPNIIIFSSEDETKKSMKSQGDMPSRKN